MLTGKTVSNPAPGVRSLALALIILGGAGVACSPAPSGTAPDLTAGVADSAARTRAAEWLRTARFEDADPVIDCRPDCREQEHGFAYARANHVERPGDCDLTRVQNHASEDFIEGCRAYGQYLEAAGRGK